MTTVALVVLLLLSAVVSSSETAVFSLQPADRRRLCSLHAPVAAALSRPTSLLVTLLLANLLVNVGYFSVSAGMSLQLIAEGRPVASAAFAVVSVAALVVAGEIVPKTLALAAPAALVAVVAPLLIALRLLLSPLVFLGEAATRVIEAAIPGSRPAPVEADDFKSAVSRRAALGTFHAVELALLHDVIDFGELRARTLMVPRVDVAFLDVRDSRAEWIASLAARPFADYPVCDGSPDRLLGSVNAAAVLGRPTEPAAALIEPALIAPVSIGAERLVERMREEGRRLAILLDEHGGVAGVVGLGALGRAVLGEIETVPATAASAIRRRGAETLLVRGDCPVRVLEEEGGVTLPARRAGTVAGAVAEALGRMPRRGDEVLAGGQRLRVLTTRRRRADLVVIRPRTGDRP